MTLLLEEGGTVGVEETMALVLLEGATVRGVSWDDWELKENLRRGVFLRPISLEEEVAEVEVEEVTEVVEENAEEDSEDVGENDSDEVGDITWYERGGADVWC